MTCATEQRIFDRDISILSQAHIVCIFPHKYPRGSLSLLLICVEGGGHLIAPLICDLVGHLLVFVDA
jgi:hypothetical protein